MQILHPFTCSIQQYLEEISDCDRYRPDHCPQCQAKPPLTAHGFYHRTLGDVNFDGDIPVRRYLCHSCKRTVSLLPHFALPFLRFSIPVISLFLIARLLNGYTLKASAQAAAQPAMPYQWPTLEPPFSTASRRLVPGTGRIGRSPYGSALRSQSLAHAPNHRLDSGAPLPLFRLANAPVRLAPFSRSRRPSRRAPAGFAGHLRLPTQHLHSLQPATASIVLLKENPQWMPKPKNSPCFATA
jgi:uncharacterized protein DUF6431